MAKAVRLYDMSDLAFAAVKTCESNGLEQKPISNSNVSTLDYPNKL